MHVFVITNSLAEAALLCLTSNNIFLTLRIECFCQNKASALLSAAEHGRTECVRLLLQSWVGTEYIDSVRRSAALICAAQHGATDCVRVLLDAGADTSAFGASSFMKVCLCLLIISFFQLSFSIFLLSIVCI